jgi:hypothetical protein
MVNKDELCDKISDIYPELGSCDQKLMVSWDNTNNAWAVDFEVRGEKIRHYLENSDAAACMLNSQCVGMGIEFGQFL